MRDFASFYTSACDSLTNHTFNSAIVLLNAKCSNFRAKNLKMFLKQA